MDETEVKKETGIAETDPYYWTEMIDDKGERFRAKPEHIDQFVREGSKLWNDQTDVDVVKDWYKEPQTIKPDQLPDLINQGYSYSIQKQNEWQDHLQYLEEMKKPKPMEMDATKTIIASVGAAASGASFGATDALMRGLWEIGEEISGEEGYASRQAEFYRDIREGLGAGDTLAQIIGGVITGGAIVGLGKNALQKAGLASLEGALSGAGEVMSRDVMGDPRVTASDYVFSTGFGAVLGGTLGFAGDKLASRLARSAEPVESTVVREIPLTFGGSVDDLIDATTMVVKPVPIRIGDDLVGTVTLSRNVMDAPHKGSILGVSIEDVNFLSTAKLPEGAEVALIKGLTDRFGSVSSSSTLAGEAADRVSKLLNPWGVSKVGQSGDRWLEVTASDLPEIVGKAQKTEASLQKLALKILGKKPDPNDDPVGFQRWEKAFNPENGVLRDELIEFAVDKAKATVRTREAVQGFANMVDDAVIVSDKIRMSMGEELAEGGAEIMRKRIDDLSKVVDEADISIKGLEGLGGFRNSIGQLKRDLADVVTETDPLSAWRKLFEARKAYKSSYDSVSRAISESGMKTRVGDIHRKVYRDLKDSLASKEIIGGVKANDFFELDALAQKSIDASRAFKKAFQNKDGSVNSKKLSRTWKSRDPGAEMDDAKIIEDARILNSRFVSKVREIQGKGLAQGIDIPDPVKTAAALNEFNRVRDMYRTLALFQKARGGNKVSNFATSALASLGSVVGTVIGGTFGFPITGNIAGAALATAASRSIGDPMVAMSAIQKAGSVDSFLSKLAARTAQGMSRVAPKAMPRVNRGTIVAALGLKDKKDNAGYINEANTKIARMNDPELIAMNNEDLPDEVRELVVKQITDNLSYVQEKIPKVPKGQQASFADTQKLDRLLLAMTNPAAALRRGALYGEADSLNHVAVMYPDIVTKFQSMLSKELDDDTVSNFSYQNKILAQQLLGANYTGTSLGASRLAQGVHAAAAEEEPGGGLTPPPMTVGSAIQK